eukprot:3911333-Amphidinium_carterae.1
MTVGHTCDIQKTPTTAQNHTTHRHAKGCVALSSFRASVSLALCRHELSRKKFRCGLGVRLSLFQVVQPSLQFAPLPRSSRCEQEAEPCWRDSTETKAAHGKAVSSTEPC